MAAPPLPPPAAISGSSTPVLGLPRPLSPKPPTLPSVLGQGLGQQQQWGPNLATQTQHNWAPPPPSMGIQGGLTSLGVGSGMEGAGEGAGEGEGEGEEPALKRARVEGGGVDVGWEGGGG